MKKWTKQNMKLLSKLRANTKDAAASQKEQQEQQQKDRMNESQSQAGGAARDSHPFDEEHGTRTSNASNNNNSSSRPPSASSWFDRGSSTSRNQQQTQQSPQQQHQQQPIHHELFYFFVNRSWKKKLFTILVIAMFIPVFLDLFILQTGVVSGTIDNLLDWMAEYPLLGVWAYIAMVSFASLIFIPPSILIFGAGFTFQSIWGASGILIALVASFIGSMVGGLIGFLRARYMTRDLIEVLMRRYPIIKAVDAAVVKNSLKVMMLMRLNCLIPFGVLNYVFGITGVDWADFLLAMVSIIPWHLLLVCLGAGSQTMYDESAATTEVGVILISTGIAFMILGMVITWRHARGELQKVSRTRNVCVSLFPYSHVDRFAII